MYFNTDDLFFLLNSNQYVKGCFFVFLVEFISLSFTTKVALFVFIYPLMLFTLASTDWQKCVFQHQDLGAEKKKWLY